MKKISLMLLGSVILFASCSKDAEPETGIDSKSLELNFDKEHQFTIKKGNEDLSTTYKWSSTDQTVGTVGTDGKFIARKVGSTVISAKADGQEYMSWITVKPYSTIFREIDFDFGMDKSAIKAKTQRSIIQESDNALIYAAGDENVSRIIFIFGSDGLLAGAAVDFKDTEAVKKEADTFYKERYPVTASVPGSEDPVYISDLRDKAVRLTSNESLGFYASYGRITITNGRVAPNEDLIESVLKNIR